MQITILSSNPTHPVNEYLRRWITNNSLRYEIKLVHSLQELSGGDFLFLISCSEIVNKEHRDKYLFSLVLHASDLPKGRGWSPHVWELINGAETITLCLLEAEDKVDTGKIWLKKEIQIPKTALWSEVNSQLFEAEIALMNQAIKTEKKISPTLQENHSTTNYYRRRNPTDSELDPKKSIAQQFDLLRMCDPDRFPAWLTMYGQKYKLTLEKVDNDDN